jgi:NAD(P) transhydrogenase subunit alpha
VSELSIFFALLTVFVLAIFVGFEVISKVPTTLHTPLMSATNAIHGIVLVGAIIVTVKLLDPAHSLATPLLTTITIVAVALGTINVVGGFAVTERMLQMFKKREPSKK